MVSSINLRVPAGKASPSPAIASALGQRGVNIMNFCKACNAETSEYPSGTLLGVVVTIFDDKSFKLFIKGIPTSNLIKQILGLQKASATPGKQVVAQITLSQIKEIAVNKLRVMTAYDLESAIKSISGTACSMGIKVVD